MRTGRTLHPEDVISRYRVVGPLGAGGMGAVHESIAWLSDGSGLVRSGQNLESSVSRQISIVSYPDGTVERLTNDVNDYRQVTASSGDEAIAAVRFNRLANLWLADASGGEARPLTLRIRDGGRRVDCLRGPERPERETVVRRGERGRTEVDDVRGQSGGQSPERAGFHVWRVDLDGSRARVLTPNTVAQLADAASDVDGARQRRHDLA